MRNQAIDLEETRLQDIDKFEDYRDFHERHRVFPDVFEDRDHKRIIDVAAGIGCAAQRIRDFYPGNILCNDITPKCLKILEQAGLPTISFDLDNDQAYPFPNDHFDAVISLSTIEHLIHVDHFLKEIHRILNDKGYLYISSPNYASISYLRRYILYGKTFHDPLSSSTRERYEFYAHLRYFTYSTLQNFVCSFGFILDTIYLPLPAGSFRYKQLYASSKFKALTFRYLMWLMYNLLSPRWAFEPVLCFQKVSNEKPLHKKPRRVVI